MNPTYLPALLMQATQSRAVRVARPYREVEKALAAAQRSQERKATKRLKAMAADITALQRDVDRALGRRA